MLNPFGCPGLQAGIHTKNEWPWWKRTTWRFVQFLIILLLIVFSPLILIGALTLVPSVIYQNYQEEKNQTNEQHGSGFTYFLLIMAGLLLLPFTIIFFLLYLFANLVSFFFTCVCCCCVKKKPTKGKRVPRPQKKFLGSEYYEKVIRQRSPTNTMQRAANEVASSEGSIPSENRSVVVNID